MTLRPRESDIDVSVLYENATRLQQGCAVPMGLRYLTSASTWAFSHQATHALAVKWSNGNEALT